MLSDLGNLWNKSLIWMFRPFWVEVHYFSLPFGVTNRRKKVAINCTHESCLGIWWLSHRMKHGDLGWCGRERFLGVDFEEPPKDMGPQAQTPSPILFPSPTPIFEWDPKDVGSWYGKLVWAPAYHKGIQCPWKYRVFITLDRMAIIGDGWVRLKPKSILSGFTLKGDVSK